LTAYSLRSRAGFVSHRPRSWDSPFGACPSRKVSGALPPGWTHVPFRRSVIPTPKRWAGPTGYGSWGLTLPRVPYDRRGFSPSVAGCSHGSWPFQGSHRRPCPGLLPGSSPALRTCGDCSPRAPAPQSINRPATCLAPPTCRSTPTGQGHPRRVSAPAQSRAFRRAVPRAMCSPPTASGIAADRRWSLGEPPRPTGVAGIG